jgi:hypothetical protein
MADDQAHATLTCWIGGLPPADETMREQMREWDRDGVPAELVDQAHADLDAELAPGWEAAL